MMMSYHDNNAAHPVGISCHRSSVRLQVIAAAAEVRGIYTPAAGRLLRTPAAARPGAPHPLPRRGGSAFAREGASTPLLRQHDMEGRHPFRATTRHGSRRPSVPTRRSPAQQGTTPPAGTHNTALPSADGQRGRDSREPLKHAAKSPRSAWGRPGGNYQEGGCGH